MRWAGAANDCWSSAFEPLELRLMLDGAAVSAPAPTPTSLTDMAPNTSYRVHVPANDGSDVSDWRQANDLFATSAAVSGLLDNNLQVVDLSDLDGDLPLDVVSSTQILWQTQNWEHSSWGNDNWPAGGHESLGFPTVVKNTHGANPDNKYYLYYAHHDPMSGIGCAVASSIKGPYTKISPTDSQVLTVPNYNPAGPNPGDPSHYSSPSVVWNADENLWFMYFHYFNHYHGAWEGSPAHPGYGYQMTALATTPDLSSHNWTIWTDSAWGAVSVWDIVPVHPTTAEAWSDSASSYNSVHRLPTGQWLAFLRGTNFATGKPTVGFATSDDGRNWDYFPQNPVIAPGKSWTVDTSEYRPKFVGYLGEDGSGEDEYLVAWAEHSAPHVIYSKTTDFKTFQRDPRGYANWGTNVDGIVNAIREGDRLYLFSGKYVHEMALSVSTQNQAPTRPGFPSASAVSNDRATVSWAAATDPDGDALTYAVHYRKTDLSTNWNPATVTSNTQLTITGLDADTSYNVRLRASDGQLNGPWRWATNLFTTTAVPTQNGPPAKPGFPSASAVSNDHATISWAAATDPDGDLLTYIMRYRKTDGSTNLSPPILTSNTQLTITGLDADTSYNVRLRASDGQLNSPWRWATNLFTTSGSGTGAWPYVEDFDDGQARDFVPQTGAWSVNNGWYELQEASNDAVSVLTPPEPLPADFQIDATLSVQAGGSWKNAYVVFDHEGPRNFKVAAVVAGSNRLRLGHATPAGFEWDTTVSRRVDLDTPYGVRVEISGSVTTLSVDGAALLTHDYGEVLSDGDLGLGSRRSHARFDNVVVQPTNQTIHSDDFEDGVAELFTPEVGTWSVVGGSYQVQTQNEDTMSVLNLGGPGALPGDFDLDVTLSVQSGGDWKNAYVIFDRVDATNYKIAAAVAGSNRWRLGQRTSSGLVWHQTLIQAITLDTNYQVRLSVRGSTAALSVDGAVLVAHDYDEPLSDGALALASRRSHARFDDLIVSA